MLDPMRRALIIGVLAIAASAAAAKLKPDLLLAEVSPAADFETAVPKTFGDWKTLDLSNAVILSQDVQQKLDETYDQLVSRTYVSEDGYRIMLAIAYGSNQGDGTEVHKPEVCYPAQGFAISNRKRGVLETNYGAIPVRTMNATAGRRLEPITYWIVSGRKVVDGNIEKKYGEMLLSLDGLIPDGLLFRVSSIDADQPGAFRRQEAFVRQLLDAVQPELRKQLAGLSEP